MYTSTGAAVAVYNISQFTKSASHTLSVHKGPRVRADLKKGRGRSSIPLMLSQRRLSGRNAEAEKRATEGYADGQDLCRPPGSDKARSEEHTSELQSLMRISYAVFCLKKKTTTHIK